MLSGDTLDINISEAHALSQFQDTKDASDALFYQHIMPRRTRLTPIRTFPAIYCLAQTFLLSVAIFFKWFFASQTFTDTRTLYQSIRDPWYQQIHQQFGASRSLCYVECNFVRCNFFDTFLHFESSQIFGKF